MTIYSENIPTEIERKFLVTRPDWRRYNTTKGSEYVQGYLTTDPAKTIRVRITPSESWLTVKGAGEISRSEIEFNIPRNNAYQLLTMCDGLVVSKVRHIFEYDGRIWEVDVFTGANEGLVVAEVELMDESPVPTPPWADHEITHDSRYFNSQLARHPFTKW